ncbi:MAG: pyruvate kinase [Peptoclostridium sp.]|uniref:pyruvate kinase n=1 Tax=Peptoclostridium sp. TaxID=1904860 RepID=UPI00139EC932|nr:pyruvate kinase [Peptoclostridium sp.]MZQ74656.1 pyruvate kinase [Peptoclostridium sp.]
MQLKKTKIVATIGPASEEESVLEKLIESGLDVCRLNFSHGSHKEHKTRIETIKRIRTKLDIPVAIMLDTKGPEIRTGKFKNGRARLEQNSRFVITTYEVLGDETMCSVSYEGITRDVSVGDRILIDDGNIALVVEQVHNDSLTCIVENPGEISDRKGVNIPGAKINLPAVTQKDVEDVIFGIENGIDFIAASFTRKAADVLDIRRVLEQNGGESVKIIAKIENAEGVANADEIMKVADGLMVARGDLGVEIPAEEVPLVQKRLIKKCNLAGKPVITATQMLDSMIRNPRPTRAEVADVANAIFDGTDAIMLSGETAAGRYPLEAVRTMSNIALTIEKSINHEKLYKRVADSGNSGVTNAVSRATCSSAWELGASGIITATSSGLTARMVSRFRPKCRIIAVTSSESVQRSLSLVWGVSPILSEKFDSTDILIEDAISRSLEKEYIKSGELVIITAGVPVGIAGGTNLMKVHVVGEVLAKGIGIGKTVAEGRACVATTAEECASKFKEGDVLVCVSTDADMNKYMELASAIVTEEGGLTSHAAIVGLNLGKPVIVSAKDATANINDCEIVTIDTPRGIIYRGSVRVL